MREGRNVEQQQNNNETLLGGGEGPSTSYFDQYKLGDCWKSQFSCNLILIQLLLFLKIEQIHWYWLVK